MPPPLLLSCACPVDDVGVAAIRASDVPDRQRRFWNIRASVAACAGPGERRTGMRRIASDRVPHNAGSTRRLEEVSFRHLPTKVRCWAGRRTSVVNCWISGIPNTQQRRSAARKLLDAQEMVAADHLVATGPQPSLTGASPPFTESPAFCACFPRNLT